MRSRHPFTSARAALGLVVVLAACSGGDPVQPEVQQEPDPSIQLAMQSVEFDPTSSTYSPTRNIAITNGGGGSLAGLSVAISYGPGESGWLSASLSGTTAPATLELEVKQNGLGPTPGSYSATVTVSSTSAGSSPRAISVTYVVPEPDEEPVIALSQTAVTINATAGGANPANHTVQVTNAGTGTLTGLSASITYIILFPGQPHGWLTASVAPSSAPATLTLAVNTSGFAAGTYKASVFVKSSDPAVASKAVSVTLELSAPAPTATIALSATSRSFTAVAGGANPGAQSLSIGNSGTGTLSGLAASISYQGGEPTGWLATSLSSTNAPATLTFQATTGSLPAGTYHATVSVTSPVATNSPQSVSVTFTVSAPLVAPALQTPGVNGSTISLTWTYSWTGLGSSNDGFSLEQSTTSSSSGFSQVAFYPGNQSSHTVQLTRQPGTYYFRVRALTAKGYTPYSQVRTVVIAGATDIVAYATQDNTLIYSTVDATPGNTVYRLGALEVGCNFSVLPFGTEFVCGEALMRFDVQSQIAGKTIVSAELRLYPHSIGADQGTSFGIAAVARSWSTTTVTSNSFHNGSEVYTSGQVTHPAPITTAVPMVYDVTTIVRNWANGTFLNNGLLMYDTVSQLPGLSLLRAISLDSSDSYSNLARRPTLIIKVQ